MIRPCIAFLALSLCAFPARAQSPDPLFTASKQQLAVAKVLLAQEQAWNNGDMDGYLAHFKDAPDTQVILAVPTRGLANIRSAFHLNYPNRDSMGTLENSQIEVRELGENFALATGKYHLARSKKAGGEAQGTFTEIFEKTSTGWQIIFSEAT